MIYDVLTEGERRLGMQLAAAALRGGGLVVVPTDTVYGLAADAFTPAAVDALLAVKGRGRDVPVPVLVGSRRMLAALLPDLGAAGEALVERFWPGALTVVARHTPHLAWDLGETRGTVAVRMPDHPLALELLEETGPLAVSSANRSGLAPAATAAEAQEQFGDAVSVYLESGPLPGGLPSTIVDLTQDGPRVLREGAVSLEELRAVVPDVT